MDKLVEVSLKGKKNLAPIAKQPQRILDLGTGTGIWALEMGTRPGGFLFGRLRPGYDGHG